MLLLIDENENCVEGGSWRFHALEPPRPVSCVRLYETAPTGEWFDVIGWMGKPDRPMCDAMAQKIDDSGSGVAYLVTGGDWGVRLRPADDPSEWSVRNHRQRGAPYVVVPSINDVRMTGAKEAGAL